jgi:hypothetical protein
VNQRPILYAAAALLAAAAVPLQAQPKVFATGLVHPAKMVLGPSGSLIVTEFDDKPNSGRISIVNSTGTRRTLIDGLPSGVSTEGPDGPTGLYLDGNTLYVAIGEGDQLSAGPTQGTNVPNPKGPASPVLASILQIDFASGVDKITAGFTLKAADHNTLADGNPATLDNGAGDKATISLLAHFRYRPDPQTIYRNSHPYALAKNPGDDSHLYLADAGLNGLVQVDLPSGRARRLTSFAGIANPTPSGPPFSDAVPDSIRPFAGKLLVTLLTGFPFVAGNSRVMVVDAATGKADVMLGQLTSAIDIAWRSRFFGGLDFYVLEFSGNFLANAPGRLKLVNAAGTTVVADNLPAPSTMVLDPAANKLYIATIGAGNILQLDLPK